MDESRKTKNRVIITLLIVIAIMITAVIVLAYNNDYILKPGTSDGNGIWRVEFTSIAEGEKKGNALSLYHPYYTATFASFYATFVVPGDEITYDVQISNLGTLNARLSNILYIEAPNKEAIQYRVEGIQIGDVLKAGESKNFKIRISYELNSTVAIEFDKPISLSFVFEQAY